MKKIRITWKDGTTEEQLVDEIIRHKKAKNLSTWLAVRKGDLLTAYPSRAITELPDDPEVASPSEAAV